MSYDRYDTTLLELHQIIESSNVSHVTKGEFLGYFIDHVIHRYIQIPEGRGDQFNANLFPAGTRKSLDLMVQRIASLLCTSDPVGVAKDLRYILHEATKRLETPQCADLHLFIRGCVSKTIGRVQEPLDTSLGLDPKDRVMASRRRLVAMGVLSEFLARELVV